MLPLPAVQWWVRSCCASVSLTYSECNEHVPSNLGVTGATWPSADVDLIGEQLDRLEALRIVGADRGENGVE